MRDYVRTALDNGGAHINSGIPNRAFALLAIDVGGYAWQRAGRICYDALREPLLSTTARFATFAAATVRAAQHLSDGEARSVRDAWREVGIEV